MMRSKLIVFLGAALLFVGVLFGLQIGSAVSSDDTYEYLRKLEDAFLIVSRHYVDDLDTNKLSEGAIEGLLKELDPHSVYIDAERMRRVNEDFNASFEGIGIQYEFVEGFEEQDTLAVLNALPGGPSEKAGLMAGDRIVAVDGESSVGWTTEDVQKSLKGPRGTKVEVTVIRPGYAEPLDFTITRDKIPLFTRDAAYLIDDQTGYIKLNRFARTTYEEFHEALRMLRADGMQRLILDLRGNAGGFMDQAIRISDEFLGGRQTIVSARGRLAENTMESRARPGGDFEQQPVILLVDENSASASEIVAGALQDHDRALIIGRRTFGKGLVQKQYSLNDGSAIRVTISRYYTPAGRLIQTPYENGDRADYYQSKRELRQQAAAMSLDELLGSVPDSLKYETDGGRIVVGGGGIFPDVLIRRDTISTFLQTVLGRDLDDGFARQWFDGHRDEMQATWGDPVAFGRNYEVTDAMLDDFLAFAEGEGVTFVATPEATLNEEGERKARTFTREEALADRDEVVAILRARLAVRLFDHSGQYPALHQIDETVQEAMMRWSEAEALATKYAANNG